MPEGGQGQARAHQRIDPEGRLITAGRGPSRQRALEARHVRDEPRADGGGWSHHNAAQAAQAGPHTPAHASTGQSWLARSSAYSKWAQS